MQPLLSKKIFITIPWFLPAFRAGGPIQSVANLVKEFKEGVSYFIFCGDTDLNGSALENVETDKWVPFNEHTQVWYCSPEKISDSLVKQVEVLKPDLLYIIGIYSWHFNIVPLMFCKGTKKIVSTRGMLHPGALAQKKWKKKVYLWLFKLLEYHYKVAFHATDADEANYITQYFGEPGRVYIAGNFPNQTGMLPLPEKEPGYLKLITIAIISPMKNILLGLEALEKAAASIRYDIYGPIKDEEYWNACKEKIKVLPKNITVHYHKEILPEDIKGVLADTHVFISPSKSENFGHAIYEALSAGRPVITSHFTPWNDLKEAKGGMNVSTDYTIEITEAVEFFSAMHGRELELWGRGAFEYSQRAVEMEKVRGEYEEMFLGEP
jgi:glycosyltransferase involved in cell wall biosynthesis